MLPPVVNRIVAIRVVARRFRVRVLRRGGSQPLPLLYELIWRVYLAGTFALRARRLCSRGKLQLQAHKLSVPYGQGGKTY